MKSQLINLGLIWAILLPSITFAHDKKITVNPPGLPNTVQFGYSQATIVEADAKIVYVAGQVGQKPGGPNDFESQVDRAFDSLLATLNASGAGAEDVLKITLLIVDYDAQKLKYMVKKRRAVFGNTPPASTLIPVPALYAPGVLFEIDAVAITK
jgi:enamine deaminase RidA (YjgF/YER057c/UK114 family)